MGKVTGTRPTAWLVLSLVTLGACLARTGTLQAFDPEGQGRVCPEVCADTTGWQCVGNPPTCQCASGYQDNDANQTCLPTCATAGLTCGAHGDCSDVNGQALCDCQAFYGGAQCEVCVVYVDAAAIGGDGSSWSRASAALQDAIDTAANLAPAHGGTCEVWVAANTYHIHRSSTADSVMLRQGVTLYGGFRGTERVRGERDSVANPTILAGDAGDGDDSHRVAHVLTASSDGTAPAPTETGLDGGPRKHGRTGRAIVAPDDGGAGLLIADGAQVQVSNCAWLDNRAARDGGAIYVSASQLAVEASVFNDNRALGGDGGAIYASASEVSITTTALDDNVASGNGGAVYVLTPTTFTLDNASFSRNSAYSGGAVASAGGQATIGRCELIDNISTYTGGALTALSTSTMIKDSLLVGNRAQYGGAVYAEAPLTMNNCQVASNSATAFGGGVMQGGPLVLTGSALNDNLAVYGGGLLVSGTSITIERCTFASNFAAADGGAIDAENTATTPATITDTLIVGNRSEGEGALSLSNGPFAVEACTFANNTGANSALAVRSGSLVGVDNSIVFGNQTPEIHTGSAPDTAAIWFTYSLLLSSSCDASSTCHVDATDLATDPLFHGMPSGTGRWSSLAYDSATGTTTLMDNTARWQPRALVGLLVRPSDSLRARVQLPVIANEANTVTITGDWTTRVATDAAYSLYDYHLSATSPCLGKGHVDATTSTTDLEGTTRGPSFNMGAYQTVQP